jgi:hypothetical protein
LGLYRFIIVIAMTNCRLVMSCCPLAILLVAAPAPARSQASRSGSGTAAN